MGIISTVVVGGLAGFVAKLFLPEKNEPKGILMTIVAGILGGVLFTYLGQMLGLYNEGDAAGFIGTVIGAVIVSIIVSKVFGRK